MSGNVGVSSPGEDGAPRLPGNDSLHHVPVLATDVAFVRGLLVALPLGLGLWIIGLWLVGII